MLDKMLDQRQFVMGNIPSLEISKASLAEAIELVEIEKECLLARWTVADYRKEIVRESSIILTAKYKTKERKTEIVGFITSRLTSPIQTPDKTKTYTELDVLNFGVPEKNRRRGVGGALLGSLIEQAGKIGIESIWLEVRQSNLEAVNLYKKKGFSVIQTRKNFYTQPLEDALVLKLAV
jgi:ribosomal-protein-alanine N-acetyltransferase